MYALMPPHFGSQLGGELWNCASPPDIGAVVANLVIERHHQTWPVRGEQY
jgi:hypothetical protein